MSLDPSAGGENSCLPVESVQSQRPRTWEEALGAAKKLEVKLEVISASTEEEIDTAFEKLLPLRVDGLIVAGEPFFDSRRLKIVNIVARRLVPTIYFSRENVVAGGLMSYGTNQADSYRQAGIYVGRVLKGEKPAICLSCSRQNSNLPSTSKPPKRWGSRCRHVARRSRRGDRMKREMSAFGTKRTSGNVRPMSAFGGEADIPPQGRDFRF